MLKTYIEQSQVVDTSLLDADKLSYAVLFNVLGGTVKKVITDHERIIIAHTAPIFPTWIWAPDDVTAEELELIWQTIQKEFVPIKDYRFNTKYEIATYLLERMKQEQIYFQITVNLAAYECPLPKAPKRQVDGCLELMKKDDVELAARLIGEASMAIGDHILSEEQCLEAAKEQLERQCLYIWRNGEGEPVAFCDRNEDAHYTKISQVYTIPEARGKSYAGRMIYEICQDVVAKGQMPMLYADGDYVPSNRCYRNIGFELKGKLVTIGKSLEI